LRLTMQINLQPLVIHAKTISEAWFQILYNILDRSYLQPIQRGSFEKEQVRYQLPSLTVFIEKPWEDMVPEIPPHLGIPSPTNMEFIEEYFVEYLMNPELAPNETYRYSSRIHYPMPKGGTQLERVIQILKETPLTNQAVIEVGTPEDYDTCYGKDGKLDPPCLRIIDFKVIPVEGKLLLTVSVYFSSWDLWTGFPTNLGGIELLKQYVAMEAGLENGPMYAYSSGAHIYGYQVDLVKARIFRK
jgi:thymidylate synthase